MNKYGIVGMVKKKNFRFFLIIFLADIFSVTKQRKKKEKKKEDPEERELTISLESFGMNNGDWESENANQS